MPNINTPLHIAVQNGNIEIVKTLLESGYTVDARNVGGHSPLDLAVISNNDVIIRLLLSYRSSNNIHQTVSPLISLTIDPHKKQILTAEQRKDRMTLLTAWYIGLFVVSLFFRFFAETVLGWSLHVIALLLSFSLYYCFILRLWEEIPSEIASMTPQKAAGLSLVPFFAYYWIFIAIVGLYRDINKTIEANELGNSFIEGWAVAACIGWLIIIVASVIIGVAGLDEDIILECLFGLLDMLITIPIFCAIRNDIFKFIDMKAGKI